jgi:hypothetical protein
LVPGTYAMAAKNARSLAGETSAQALEQGAKENPAAPSPAGDFALDVCYFETSIFGGRRMEAVKR